MTDMVLLPKHAVETLNTIEIVLTHLSPEAEGEVTEILAAHENWGGIGHLIDMVQFAKHQPLEDWN